jgi:23S rRNA (cytosine1962-C5)-methyltransferase
VIEGKAFVSERGAARVKRGHPWIFRSDVEKVEGAGPGAIVEVRRRRDRLGFAFHSDRSQIQLRMLERGDELRPAFLGERLAAALAFRRSLAPEAAAYRLVHGEGDGIPGLVVDAYGDHLVVQTLIQGTERLKEEVVRSLVELLHPRGILERNDPRVRLFEGLDQRAGVLMGDVPERVEVDEGGIVFEVDLLHGQKTGLFLDQRENHAAAASYARGRVLDAFCYTGGFALPAARRAESVVAVDASGEALAQLARNASRNGLSNIQGVEGNVFDHLRELEMRRERFETVILDPPAFAKNKGTIPSARRGYKEINLRAIRLLAPGGILVTCSCSHHVDAEDFQAILEDAAADAGVALALVERRSQARDHPIALGVPETSYLKGLILRRP